MSPPSIKGLQRFSERASKRIEKRTGLNIHWKLVPLLGKLYRAQRQLKRGLTEEEIRDLWGIPSLEYSSLISMMKANLLKKERGGQFVVHKNSMTIPQPVALFSLSSDLERFSLIWDSMQT